MRDVFQLLAQMNGPRALILRNGEQDSEVMLEHECYVRLAVPPKYLDKRPKNILEIPDKDDLINFVGWFEKSDLGVVAIYGADAKQVNDVPGEIHKLDILYKETEDKCDSLDNKSRMEEKQRQLSDEMAIIDKRRKELRWAAD